MQETTDKVRQIRLKVSPVFARNLEAYKEGARYIINQGGSRSGKTYGILQLLILIALTSAKPLIISVISSSYPHLKRGAVRDFSNIMLSLGIYDHARWNASSLTYTFPPGSIIEFFSSDQPHKVYGAARDILFLNECNSIPEESARHAIIRTREVVFFDFNPTSEFYVHTDYLNRHGAAFVHSTYKDNPFLEDTLITELIETGLRNENFNRVFVLGEIGRVEGAVFSNWEVGAFKEGLALECFGLDLGYNPDPATLVRVAVDMTDKVIYLQEMFYATNLSFQALVDNVIFEAGRSIVVADTNEPRLVEEMRRRGVNIRSANKTKGSKRAGLIMMQDYKLIVTEDSKNLQKELRYYVWIDEGIAIDIMDHAIDAARYAFDFLANRGEGRYKMSIV